MKPSSRLNTSAILLGGALAAAILAPSGGARASAVSNVAEAAGYSLVYSLALPNRAAFNFNAIPYLVDNHAQFAANSFSRIAYYLELQKANAPLQYVYASMNAFTGDAGLIGIPNRASGALFQQNVASMNVFSNVSGVVTGTGITTGSLEFWSTDYAQFNAAGVPGANNSTYDFGDQRIANNNYGSLQVNNYGASQTVLAYNSWGSTDTGKSSDLGIGNQPMGNPDWTFASNASGYTVKNLEVYVLSLNAGGAQNVPEPASMAILGLGLVAAGLYRRRRA